MVLSLLTKVIQSSTDSVEPQRDASTGRGQKVELYKE